MKILISSDMIVLVKMTLLSMMPTVSWDIQTTILWFKVVVFQEFINSHNITCIGAQITNKDLSIQLVGNHIPWSFTWSITNYNTETVLVLLLKTPEKPMIIWLF